MMMRKDAPLQHYTYNQLFRLEEASRGYLAQPHAQKRVNFKVKCSSCGTHPSNFQKSQKCVNSTTLAKQQCYIGFLNVLVTAFVTTNAQLLTHIPLAHRIPDPFLQRCCWSHVLSPLHSQLLPSFPNNVSGIFFGCCCIVLVRSLGSVNINLSCMPFLCYKTSCSYKPQVCGVLKEYKAYAFSFPLVNPPKAADLMELSHFPEDLMKALMSS